jgi:ABC-type multidrug transport system ATPase subunit
MSDAPPVLELVTARIDREGIPLLDGISAIAKGPRVALLGDWTGLFDLIDARGALVGGTACVLGVPLATALADGVVASVRRDLVLPKGWTLTRYLEQSARLLGMSASDATTSARGVLAMLGLAAMAGKQLGTLRPHERRAAAIARARLGEPNVLAFEAPLTNADAERAYVLELIERAVAGRACIVSTDDTNPTDEAATLADRANDVLVLEHGTLVGALRAERYLVSVTANAQAFAEALARDGLVVHVANPNGTYRPFDAATSMSGALRFVIETASSEPILAASIDANSPVVELRPLGTRAAAP